MNGVSPSNYDCEKAVFIFDEIPFQKQRTPLSEPVSSLKLKVFKVVILSVKYLC